MASRTLRLAIALTSLCVAIVPAVARALAVPQTSSFCQLSDGSSTSGALGCAQGDLESVALSLAPQVTLLANFNSAPGFDTVGSVRYDFQVVGGNAGDSVPVLVDAQLSTVAAGSSFASAGILVSVGSFFVQKIACTNPSQCAATSFDGTLELTMLSGQTGTIDLTIQAAAGFPLAGAAQAFADPFIRIDPAFANAGLYGVVVPDGVGNAPLPEPAVLLLSLVGLVVVCTRVRIASYMAGASRVCPARRTQTGSADLSSRSKRSTSNVRCPFA
jgi:hypothetical protein